mmetsp:Transcript_25680/g.74180  ORF Transcript_25680/g.74180 Transcript_25680/m.74180 type:complete len:138 (-) Transcript_25680:276-689(-)
MEDRARRRCPLLRGAARQGADRLVGGGDGGDGGEATRSLSQTLCLSLPTGACMTLGSMCPFPALGVCVVSVRALLNLHCALSIVQLHVPSAEHSLCSTSCVPPAMGAACGSTAESTMAAAEATDLLGAPAMHGWPAQ